MILGPQSPSSPISGVARLKLLLGLWTASRSIANAVECLSEYHVQILQEQGKQGGLTITYSERRK